MNTSLHYRGTSHKRVFFLVLVFFLLCGTAQLVTAQTGETATKNTDAATLYLYRVPKNFGSQFGMKILINGVYIALLANNSYTSVHVEKGQIVICAKLAQWTNYYRLDMVESGKKYFVELGFEQGWTANTINFNVIDESKGLALIQNNGGKETSPLKKEFLQSMSTIDPETINIEEKDKESRPDPANLVGFFTVARYDMLTVNGEGAGASDLGLGVMAALLTNGMFLQNKLSCVVFNIYQPESLTYDGTTVIIENTTFELVTEQLLGYGFSYNDKSILLIFGGGAHIYGELAFTGSGDLLGSGILFGVGLSSTLNIKLTDDFVIFAGVDAAYDFFNVSAAVVAAAFNEDVKLTNVHLSCTLGCGWIF
jgi:hypothetical protein